MKKYKIERTQYANDMTMTNTNRKLIVLQNNCGQQLLRSCQDSIQEKKTEKIIKPSRKRQAVVNFQKNDTISDDIDFGPCDNDMSAQVFKLNNLCNETLVQKTKTIGQENKIKTIFSNYRFQNIKKHLLSQTRKNSIYRDPVLYEPFNQDTNQDHLSKGIYIQRMILNFGYFISIAHTFIACLLTTLFIAFQEKFLEDSSFLQFQILSSLLLAAEIIVSFFRVKDVGSRKLNKIRDIASNYIRTNFFIDITCLISVLICLFSQNNNLNYLLGTFFLKIPECVEKLVKIQTKLFDSFYLEQYWGLLKVLSSNFLYAHFLAILLLMMSWLDQEKSWLHKENILNAPWYQQYSWAYYWGTTIMLTVGFGDLSATNYKQAICLVLIETVSCMAFAYNINCIGNLLKELRSGQIQKQKSLKILKKLCDKNEVNPDLDLKLTNHVKESYNIQTKFNFEQETQFIAKLPINLKEDFLRAANYKVLENLTFIKNFTNKTILALAQKLQMKISHPNQVIFGSDVNKLVILKQGQIGLFPIHNNQKYNKIIIDRFIVRQKESSCLLSLDFLQLPFDRKYDIKSTTYCQIFQMETETMISVLKRKNTDLEFFYTTKDKQKINLDNFQLIKCSHCQSNHTKFRCPRLHYMPICQQVVFKYLHKIKVGKNFRMPFNRLKSPLEALYQYKRNYEIGSKQKFQSICEMQLLSQQDFINETKSSIHKRVGIFSTVNLLNDTSSHQLFENRDSANKIVSKKFFGCDKEKENKQQHGLLSAAELMQKQVMGILNQRGLDVSFWNLQIDEAKDYKFYFNKCNPQCLQNFNLKRSNGTIFRSRSLLRSRAKVSFTRKQA